MTPVQTEKAPAAVGPYSQAMISDGLIFVSGQLPINLASGEFVSEDPVEQLRQCLANIATIAEAAGSNIQKTLKTTILVTDLSKFDALNAEYSKMFSTHKPARACFEVSALPRGAKVEIEAVIEL